MEKLLLPAQTELRQKGIHTRREGEPAFQTSDGTFNDRVWPEAGPFHTGKDFYLRE
jgi:hypothetical protein